MPFHFRFDSNQQFSELKDHELYGIKKKLFNTFTEKKLFNLRLNQIKVLKSQVNNKFAFNQLLRAFDDGGSLPPNISKGLIDDYKKWKKDKKNSDVDFSADPAIFRVQKTEFESLISQIPIDVDYRLVVKFGCEDKNSRFRDLKMFISAISIATGNPEIDEYIECVPITSGGATPIQKKSNDPIKSKTDNFIERIKALQFKTQVNEDNKKYERGGVAHHIRPVGSEMGITDFLSSLTTQDVYLYPAYGSDRAGKEKFNTVIFSEYSDLDSREFVQPSTVLSGIYDYGSSCCPPQ